MTGTGGQPPADETGVSNGGCGCSTGDSGASAGTGALVLALAGLFGRSLRRRPRRGLRD
jgi:MYXO-CTERM domain-containing protein